MKTEAAGVVIISAEDGVADTIKPRVIAAGGDPSRILFLDTVSDGKDGERLLLLPEDVPIIKRAVRRVGAKLVIIDPLMAFMNPKLDTYKDRDVRQALTPVKFMAEDTGAAVAIVRHPTKDSDKKALYRGGGSRGIIGVARSGLLVAKHPEDESRRVLAPLKSNLAKPAPSLEFGLVEAENGAVKVEWGEETSLVADDLAPPTLSKKRLALDEAKEFVQETLKNRAVLSTSLEEKAQSAGISASTLRRAKVDLGVIAKKGGNGPWWSMLPDSLAAEEGTSEDDHQEDRTAQDEHLEHLEHLGADELLAEGEDVQDVQGAQENHQPEPERLVMCLHGFQGGKGCYLCDPEHPYRLKSGATT
jgi:AAA domain